MKMSFKKIKKLFNQVIKHRTSRDIVVDSEKRKCVLIVGMHRSGTSAMSAVLNIVGLYNKVGTESAPDNPKGFYEWNRGVDINEKILKSMNSSWDDEKPFHTEHYHKKTEKFKKELMTAIKEDFSGQDYFVIKDPRVSVLLPLYIKIFELLHIEPILLMMERPAEEIYLSLKVRNGFSREKSMALCKKYRTIIYQILPRYKNIIIKFDDLVSNPIDTTEIIIDRLALPFEIDDRKEKEILNFIDPELKHHNILQFTKDRNKSG